LRSASTHSTWRLMSWWYYHSVGDDDNDGLLFLLLSLLQPQARYQPALVKRIYPLNLAPDVMVVLSQCW
jgi:hypothetical protein